MSAIPVSQQDENGRLRHLITLDGLERGLVESLLDRADRYDFASAAPPPPGGALRGWTVANLFGEPSTRTRASFEVAARRLGADVLNLELTLSSRAKGESLADTVRTLEAMRIDVLVIRDVEVGVHAQAARELGPLASIVSAGEAHVSHPTQGLLDALTIRQCKGRFDDLVVAIVGDVARSRVARSAHRVLATLGVPEIRVVAPEGMMPPSSEFAGAKRFDVIDDGIAGADVVMMLRVQRERGGGAALGDPAAYHAAFGLTARRLALAKRDAIVMHPGPMNRGVEIASSVADGLQSVILRQVTNGIAVRMAVLEEIAEARRMRAR